VDFPRCRSHGGIEGNPAQTVAEDCNPTRRILRRNEMTTTTLIRLPVPERLEPKNAKRTLMTNVRAYFYQLYNASSKAFKELLVSVGNEDSLTGNRLFDRHNAVGMIKKAAADVKDKITEDAKDGEIYRCLVRLMKQHDLGLKLRRRDYDRLTHQQPQLPAE
jgi:hypothetical protein